jgi:hippurate hydrolase
MPNIDRIEGFADELTAIRRDLHAHPEIGFEEVRTSGIVADKLTQWGIEVHRGLGGTGVVGVLKGKGQGSKRIGLRADMDALPMEENTNLRWRSTIPGRFHGCAMTAIPPCCWAPRAISRRPGISTAPCISSSSRPKKASAALAP